MSDELLQKIAALEARLAAIEIRPPDRQTMKELRRCPSCGCGKLLKNETLRCDIQFKTPLALSLNVRWDGMARPKGQFEAHVCTGCGLVELHALGLDPSILEDASVTLIKPPEDDDAGPYR